MKRFIWICAVALVATGALDARFLRPDLEKIPVERLVANLENLAEKNPKDAVIRFNLARVHAMAYALKSEEAEVWKNKHEQGAWFGHTPAFIPFKVVTTKEEEKLKAAQAHLNKAMENYKAALKLDANHLPSQLGLAWVTEQAGKKEDAVKAYLDVIKVGWKNEKELKNGPLGGNYITSEAASYLIPLLDKEKDETQIKDLQDRVAKLSKLPRPITPIAIPLRAGLTASDIEDRNAKVAFDADGSGLVKKWTWITKDAGWLVYDPQRKGKITSGLQMFGNVSFWTFWEHGYDALCTLDDNGDGVLRGKELEGLAIWVDANGDGICDADEVRPLSFYGIVALDCGCRRDLTHRDQIYFSPRGVTFRDGSTRPTFDIILEQR